MQLKLDAKGNAVLKDGMPVYIANGKEIALDAAAIVAERDKHKVAALFHQSEFVKNNMDMPARMIADYFGKYFKCDGDKVVAADDDGVIYSRERFGEPASFDEALEIILGNHYLRSAVMKPVGQRGTTKPHGADSVSSNAKTMTRKAFDAMSPKQKMAFVKADGKLTG